MKRAFLLFPFLAMPALAQESSSYNVENVQGQQVRYNKVTIVDGEELAVQAGMIGPQIQIGFERKATQFNPLIQLRKNFTDEMHASLDEVK